MSRNGDSNTMYGPAPTRPKKTGIVRARTGCKQCRLRRKKCDEKKPRCGACLRHDRPCHPCTPKLAFRPVTFQTTHDSKERELKSTRRYLQHIQVHHISPSHPRQRGQTPEIREASEFESSAGNFDPSSIGSVSQIPGDWSPEGILPEEGYDGAFACTVNMVSQPVANDVWRVANHATPNTIHGERKSPADPALSLDHHIDLTGVLENGAAYSGIDADRASDTTSIGLQPRDPHSVRDFIREIPSSRVQSTSLFYIDVWASECLPALHTAFRRLGSVHDLPPMVSRSMLALSACQISRAVFNACKTRALESVRLSIQPDSFHQHLAYQFYGSAMRQLSRCQDLDSEVRATSALAVMVLFCCLESVMGNFRTFTLHSHGIEQLLSLPDPTDANDKNLRCELVAAWNQAKLHNWWLRMHFCTPDIHQQSPPFIWRSAAKFHPEPGEDSRVEILSTLCNLYHIQSTFLAQLWQIVESRGTVLSSNAGWCGKRFLLEHSMCSSSLSLLERISQLLSQQDRRLDSWYRELESDERPLELHKETRTAFASGGASMRPRALRFLTHTAAMNYVYYTAARVLSCEGFFERVLGLAHEKDKGNPYEDSWVNMLKDVISSISWADCLRLNTHTIGISGVLLMCALRSGRKDLVDWINSWLENQSVFDSTEEGSFPVLQIRQALQTISMESLGGYDVLAVYQPIEDGGGMGKFDSYASQIITNLTILERSRDDMSLWTRYYL